MHIDGIKNSLLSVGCSFDDVPTTLLNLKKLHIEAPTNKLTKVILDVIDYIFVDWTGSLDIETWSAPNSSRTLDKASALYVKSFLVDHDNSERELIKLAKWVSKYSVPILDFGWPFGEDLIKLMGELEEVNFTQFKLPKEKMMTIFSSCKKARRILCFQNALDDDLILALSKLPLLEKIDIKWSTLDVETLNFQEFNTLAEIKLSTLGDFNKDIILPHSSLKKFSLKFCHKFDKTIDFSKLSELEVIRINMLDNWSQDLNCSQFNPKLSTLVIKHCTNFNHYVDVKACTLLKVINFDCCVSWQGGLSLPTVSPLKQLILNECRSFIGTKPLIFADYPQIEEIKLINCRSFNSPMIFKNNNNLRRLIMTNCFIFNHLIEWQELPIDIETKWNNCYAMTFPTQPISNN